MKFLVKRRPTLFPSLFAGTPVVAILWSLGLGVVVPSTMSAVAADPPTTHSVLERQGSESNRPVRPSINRRSHRRPRRPNRKPSTSTNTNTNTNTNTGTARPRPPRRLPPNRVQPGGGLDDAIQACDRNSSPLTALVPVQNPVYTASAYPTFLFHFSDPPDAIAYAEFILLSADEKEQIYTTRFVPSQSGIIPISVPAEANYALEIGEAYHWYLNVHCQIASGIPSVNGWVQRVAAYNSVLTHPPETDLLETDLPEIWYDEIAQVASTLATEESSNIQARDCWQRWLSAIGLNEIAQINPAVSRYNQLPTNTYGAQ